MSIGPCTDFQPQGMRVQTCASASLCQLDAMRVESEKENVVIAGMLQLILESWPLPHRDRPLAEGFLHLTVAAWVGLESRPCARRILKTAEPERMPSTPCSPPERLSTPLPTGGQDNASRLSSTFLTRNKNDGPQLQVL